ncbi:NADH/ubiquinone/plastoquinone (complex I) [bacterium]|nr:NADH/ubiquinone/plastoquinone (complex I) [bacterium]
MNTIAYFLVVPLGTALLLVIFGRWVVRWAGIIVSVVFSALTALVVQCYFINQLPFTVAVGGWEPVQGIPLGIHWVVDGFTLLMLALINFTGAIVALYSISSMKSYTKLRKYYALLMLLGLGMNGVALAGDLFTMYVFLEISAISSYILVAFGRGAEELEASFKYQVLGGSASMLILFAIALVYRLTGTLNIADASRVLSGQSAEMTMLFTGALFLTGFGLKAAIMPFHSWLPDAHPAAPAPVSAILSGVVIKVLGIYPLCRLFYHFIGFEGVWTGIWLVLGAISLMVANILALAQWDIKRLLAYCSISQIGYIVIAMGLGTELGIIAGLFHMANHTIFKSLLFFNAGAIEHATGFRDLRKLGGLRTKMPVTYATSLIASFSIAGLPPFSGFWSKLLIIIACMKAGHPFLAIWAALGSMLTLAAFLKFQHHGFGGPDKEYQQSIKEVSFSSQIAMIILAILCLGMGCLMLPGLRSAILEPAANILSQGLNATTLFLGN